MVHTGIYQYIPIQACDIGLYWYIPVYTQTNLVYTGIYHYVREKIKRVNEHKGWIRTENLHAYHPLALTIKPPACTLR